MPVRQLEQDRGEASESPCDGVRRYRSVRWLGNYPVVAMVGISQDEFLAPLRRGVRSYAWMALVGSVLVVIFIGALLRMHARLAGSQQREDAAQRQHMLERRHLEGQLLLTQKLEAIGQLAAGIAHEINTPVQYIGDSVLFLQTAFEELEQLRRAHRGALDQACNGAPCNEVLASLAAAEETADLEFNVREVPRAFERTMEGVERVTKIVRAMKEFSYQSSEEFSGADLNQALESTLDVARGEYKHIAVVESHFQALPLVTCDISALKQVFLNLIINAAHAIRESGQHVATGKIRLQTSVAGEWVTISVQDNGCGIPDAIASRVYDPFFTTKGVGRGTGQGLAIAHRIIATKHGGRIEFRTQVGAGTTFLIHLPVAGPAATTDVVSLRVAS
jgi:signal transduction histidine kinase